MRRLTTIMGWACVLIGAVHLVGGAATVPGEPAADPTVDSRERFYAAVFVGYGLAWIRAARQRPLPVADVRGLAAIMAVGGAARIGSWVQRGRPHWLQCVLTGVEVLLPVPFLLAPAHDGTPHEPPPRS